nr:hypothetical protein [Clostridia bacterium]
MTRNPKAFLILVLSALLLLGTVPVGFAAETPEAPIPVNIVSAHFGWAAPPPDNLVRREIAKRIG